MKKFGMCYECKDYRFSDGGCKQGFIRQAGSQCDKFTKRDKECIKCKHSGLTSCTMQFADNYSCFDPKEITLVDSACPTAKDQSENNGGSTDYYKLDPSWKDGMDIVEDRQMNYSQGNIFKAAMCFNTGRHKGTDAVREINKIIYFANRELSRLLSASKEG